MGHLSKPSGVLTTEVIRRYPAEDLSNIALDFYAKPNTKLPDVVSDWRASNEENFERGFEMVRKARKEGIPHFYGRLWITHLPVEGERIEYGLASLRVVTDAGVNFIVDAFQNTAELENMKYHGIGTDNTAEAVGDTALNTELTTQYNPDNTRATGSTTEGATANIYRTVGTNTVDSSAAIVEHGVFDQAATGGGTLLDRSVFASISLSSGDSLQTTYDLTFSSGS